MKENSIYNFDKTLAYFDSFTIITLIDTKKVFTNNDNYIFENNQCTLVGIEDFKTYNKISIKINTKPILNKTNYLHINNEKIEIKFGYIVKTAEFDKKYADTNLEFGAIYENDKVTFRIWTPVSESASVLIYDKNLNLIAVHKMNKVGKGSWETSLPAAEYIYKYQVINENEVKELIDPYAKNSTYNHTHSIVLNPNKYMIKQYKTDWGNKSLLRSILYELSIKDLTDNKYFNNKGKFLGLVETHKNDNSDIIGLEYLKLLGITHVQILPFYDFQTVDELADKKQYNWGYDPVQYNVSEGSYISNKKDFRSRVIEVKQMIETMHKNNLNVVMDVVYNHVYDAKTFSFNQLVPNYFYTIDNNGKYGNESFCGSTNDTKQLMVSKFIIDSCIYWAKFYNLDGFRFDLMGLIDTQTMNDLIENIKEWKPGFLFYGEGWNMKPDTPSVKYTNQINWHQTPEVAHFNDIFRGCIKGEGEHNKPNPKGFSIIDKNRNISNVINTILGSIGIGYTPHYSTKCINNINYVSIHDGYTISDYLEIKGVDKEFIKPVSKMMMGLVILSQGVPIIHAGHELMRSKKLEGNSYNLSIEINKFPWDNIKDNYDFIKYFQDLIKFRKENKLFRLKNTLNILNHARVSFENGIIKYNLFNEQKDILIYINVENQTVDNFEEDRDLIISSYENKFNSLLPYEFKVYIKKM
ncbi:type I pullulanase [Mycoplasma phocimorsus]|uniref:type I pullulanase n=1 Tax=Mycoplasma phocimorsus TaxID=3045839 RepID=UPI0024BF1D79|nr:type I pullulanase [Mycoplasma phocimorsus]MDJ1647101.1 type I pullulanase [Mycoplasma phocimorsus]